MTYGLTMVKKICPQKCIEWSRTSKKMNIETMNFLRQRFSMHGMAPFCCLEASELCFYAQFLSKIEQTSPNYENWYICFFKGAKDDAINIEALLETFFLW